MVKLIGRKIKEYKVFSKIIKANDLKKKNVFENVKGIILSGGPSTVTVSKFPNISKKIFNLKIPILGICAGHQFMARHYGGDARESPEPEYGAMSIDLVEGGGKIFANTGEKQIVWESHNDEVHELPEGFFVTASSESCKIQGMENKVGDRFGLQFHPEVNDSEFGNEMFSNFVEVCRKAKNA